MKWMSGVCERWNMEELANLDAETMDWLLDEGWEKGKVLDPPRKFAFNTKYIGFAVTFGVTALGYFVGHRYIGPSLFKTSS